MSEQEHGPCLNCGCLWNSHSVDELNQCRLARKPATRTIRLVVTVDVSPNWTTTPEAIASEIQSCLEWDQHLGIDAVLVETAQDWKRQAVHALLS